MRLGTRVAAALAASAVALALAGGIGAAARAQSSSSAIGRVDRAHPVVRWTGGPFELVPGLPALSNPRPEVCAFNCERRSLQLDVPSSAWKHPGDGVLIAIHWDTTDSGVNLYVYDPSGQMVGSADGLDSNGEAVFLPHAARGTYTVVVTATYMTNGTVRYKGEARVRPDPAASCAKPCALLPRLRTVPPYDFHLEGIPPVPSTQLGFPIPFGPAMPNSCYPDETGVVGAHRCLRFTNEIVNEGTGPLKMRFTFLGAGPKGARVGFVDCRMEQVVERTDGSSLLRNAGPCVFHPSHAHFHYSNFAEFTLHRVRPSGRTDPAVLRKSSKRGFCLTDVHNSGFGTANNSGRTYWFPNCNLPDRTGLAPQALARSGTANASRPEEPATHRPSGLEAASQASSGTVWETMGISPGWSDVYTWDTPDQYIEISGVADGAYDVVSTANPDGGIAEGGRRDGSARTRICLKGNTVKVMASGAKASAGCR